MSFKDKWNKTQSENMAVKILESIKSQTPLKPRIEEAQKKLEMQISKLESISGKIVEKDQLIFKRIVHSIQNHDVQYAKLLSNELSQIRKMSKMVDSAKLALEQIQLRLNTITELGDVVVTLTPAMSVIKNIQGGLTSMVPEADQSLSQISDLMGGILSDSAQIPKHEVDSGRPLSEESTSIIEEATTLVEQSMKEKFPDLPALNIDEKTTEASTY
ncbi:MAG: Snf7 family protein [Nitrososphaeraceae archaeon]